MISVIIPTYNSENYISSAIRSILEQTYQDFEIIVIDDGSTDNTRNVVDAFDDKRIKYFYQKNSGVAAARNEGLKHSKGEYIAFLDADDLWVPEKLDIQLKRIRQDEETGMVYSAISMFFNGENRSKIYAHNILSESEFIKNLLTDPFKTIPYPSTVLVKKTFIDKAGAFNPEYPTGEDWDLWLRMAKISKCIYIDEMLVEKMVHDASITSSIDLKKSEMHHFNLLNNFFSNNPEYKFLKPKAYAAIYYDLACRYLVRNNHLPTYDFYSSLLKSFFSYPPLYFTKTKAKFVFDTLVKSRFN